jgi:hypothetical protein
VEHVVISPALSKPAAATTDRAAPARAERPAPGAGASRLLVARPAATGGAAGDTLQRALADAVAARSDVTKVLAPEVSPVLARVRKKQPPAKRGPGRPRKGAGGTAGKRTQASKGVKKPRRAAPTPVPQALAVVAGPRRSGRARRVPRAIDHEIHWGDPVFGASAALQGGTSVRADLGPAAGQPVNYGSVPVVGECTAVEWLNANGYGGYAWIKGHMLNDNLGGEGISENLTPMTHTANMRYKTFESSIKRAIDECYRQGQFSYVDRWYGVRVAIDVVGQQWPHAPQAAAQAVATHVTTAAQYIEKVGAAAPVAIAQPAWGPALVTGNYACVA